ncbi:POK25 protein, partial [Spelaeornis formosus]|nr:POK25 protein [Elachura formosa]
MGALQPGLPNPAMLPQEWPILIIDLKDCFFTIPLHPQNTKPKESHKIFHQNAKGLAREFNIPVNEARAIIKTCPVCSHRNGGQGLVIGV